MEDIEEPTPTLDAHGVELANGDTVVLIEDVLIEGADKTLVEGTELKNIRLLDNVHEIEVPTEDTLAIVLRTESVKKA